MWSAPAGQSHQHYEWVELRPNGGMAAKPADVFGGHDWSGIGQYPVLVLDKGKPLLIFGGSKGDANNKDPYNDGCIVGDLFTGGSWKVQSRSLSQNCIQTDHMGATITPNGTLSAAWAWGGIRYRIGTSPSIPATTADQVRATPGGRSGLTAETTEARSGNVYAAWEQFFSKSASNDGLYVANLSRESQAVHAPGTGTNSVAHQLESVAVASPTVRGGIYALIATMPTRAPRSNSGNTERTLHRPFPDRSNRRRSRSQRGRMGVSGSHGGALRTVLFASSARTKPEIGSVPLKLTWVPKAVRAMATQLSESAAARSRGST